MEDKQLIETGYGEADNNWLMEYANDILSILTLSQGGHLAYIFICLAIQNEAKIVMNLELKEIANRNYIYSLHKPEEWQNLARKICRVFYGAEPAKSND